jgi:predicted PurR-regulated permease PerM
MQAMCEENPQRRFQRSVLFIIIAIFALIYLFFPVFVVVFGALLLAFLLSLLARPIKRRLKLRNWASLTLAGLLLFGLVGTAVYLFGTKLVLDIQEVLARMENAQQAIRAELLRSLSGASCCLSSASAGFQSHRSSRAVLPSAQASWPP